MNPSSDIVAAFAATARDYRRLIDSAESHSVRGFLDAAQSLLVRLYGLAPEFPIVGPTSDEPPDTMSLEDWRGICDRLSLFLGEKNVYWLVFDPIDPDDHESIAQTLADDLSDIYADIGPPAFGMTDAPSADEIWSLRFSFETHWGHHAVNALTAIHALLHGPNAEELDRAVDVDLT